jgi:subtilase family serine protease
MNDYSIAPDPSAFSSTAQINVEVGLTPSGSLATLESNLNNPASPSYHDYLSMGSIGSDLGVSSSTYSAIVSYFAGFGLTVEQHPDMLTISLAGTPSQFQKAFHTQISAFAESYTDANNYNPVFDKVVGVQNVTASNGVTYVEPIWQSVPQVFYANTAQLTLPAGIAKYIGSVAGLQDQLLQPQVQALNDNFPGIPTAATQTYNTTNGTWDQTGGPKGSPEEGAKTPFSLASNCDANYSWLPSSYYGAPVQLFFPSTMPTLEGACTLFTGADTILSEPDYGQGITIAVIEVGAIDPSQLAAFSALTFPTGKMSNGLTSNVLARTTYIDLGASSLSQAVDQGLDYGWYIETALDVEYAATMAPEAHIDLVSVPNPDFTSFDEAFSFIGAHLVHQATSCSIPTTDPILGPVFVYGGTTDANGGSACDVSITSNSYGSGESYTTYFGSPMYVTFESQLLQELTVEGVTSFFANGDSGGVYAVVEDFLPADSPSVIAVGGGQMTAESDGQEFPAAQETAFLESSSYSFCFIYCYTYAYGDTVNIDQVTGLESYTYWSEPDGTTFGGEVGGGFGQSIETTQPWWEVGNDTYSDGALIDPIISNDAAFNMTIYYQVCESYFIYEYCYGPWNFVYGGTSFATPISAGGWALVEEQLNQRYGPGAQYTGDIGPLLFAASNAWQAGAPTVDPYVPMENIGVANRGIEDYAPFNSFTWYYENLSIQVPDAVDHPWWSDSLFNPAIPPGWTDAKFYGGASSWNMLQGLGTPNWDTLDQILVGASDTSHAMDNDPFYVEVVTPTGLQDISELWCGESYTFEVVSAAALGNAPINVIAYSGTPNDGIAYGGGTTSEFTVTGAPWQFVYTPACPPQTVTGPDSLNTTAWTYGYFLAVQQGSNELGENAWNFQMFGENQEPLGTLNLCVSDVEDICQSAVAEETMFHTYDLEGEYNLQGQANALVTLTEPDGLVTTVESAVVVQTSVVTTLCPALDLEQDAACDPTLLPSTYAPGVVIGHYLTDSKGTADLWDNAFIAEADCSTPLLGLDNEYGDSTYGSQPVIPPECLQTQVYTVTAYDNGLVSNTVTVYVEPQTGSFLPQLQLVNGHITGFVQFADMTNVQYVNVSVGGGPGEFENVSFLPDCAEPGIVSIFGSDGLTYFPEDPGNYCLVAADAPDTSAAQATCQLGDASAFYDSNSWLCGSGVKEGVIEVNLTLPDDASAPAQVSILAVGWNDLSLNEGCFGDSCYIFPDTQYGIYWQDPFVFLPATLSASQTTSTVAGVDTFTWSGASFTGAVGTLSLVSGAGTTVLKQGLSGTYALDTSTLLDGSYSVVFTETAPGAVTSTQSVAFYADNQAASLSSLVATLNSELSADAATISSLQASVSTLTAELNAANANIAQLESQVTTLTAQVATLQSQLAAAQAQVASLTAEVASLQATASGDAATIASLQAQLATAQSTVSTDSAMITSLQNEVSTLQAELAKHNTAPAATWYGSFPGGAVGLIGLIVAIGAICGVVGVVAARRRNGSGTPSPTPTFVMPTPPPTARPKTIVATPEPPANRPSDEVFRRARAAQAALVAQGKFVEARRLSETVDILSSLTRGQDREGPETMYR